MTPPSDANHQPNRQQNHENNSPVDAQAIDRRDALLRLSTAASISLISTSVASARSAVSSVIVEENKKPGTRDWMLKNTRIDPDTRYRSPAVEGYCSHASITAGETLRVMVSTAKPADVTIDFYRIGYYGGDGARLVASMGPKPAKTQPMPTATARRLVQCKWDPWIEFEIPSDWVSGVYVGKLTELGEGIQSYVIFIVRDARNADFVFQVSDHTWQAYNRWPSQYSLYDDGVNQWHWGSLSQVSFDRPYGKYCQILDAPLSIGSGEFFLWEYPFVFWMEQNGLDVTYVSNTDTHRDAASVRRGRGWISIGHDEYWTIEMFRAVQEAIAQGVSVGFFSGNAVCGRVLWDEATRSIRRVGVFGPPGGTGDFQAMKSLEHVRPYANELIGAHSTGPVTGGADWICSKPEHWIYEGTGMKLGDRVPGVIGWEWHGDPAPIEGLDVVATGPTQSAPGQPNGGTYTATVYPGPKGNFVFNAATCWWADGLSMPPGYIHPSVYTSPMGPDERIQKITMNILQRMLKGGPRENS